MALRGDAAIRYDPGDGEVELLLDWPLFRVAPGRFTPRRRKFGLTGKTSETIVFGSGLREIAGRVRFSASPEDVLNMLEAGGNSVPLRYVPSVAGGVEIPCILIEPTGNCRTSRLSWSGLATESTPSIFVSDVWTVGDWSALPGANL